MSKALDRSQRSGSDPIVIGSTKLVTDGNNDLTVQDTSNNRKKILATELHIGDASNVVILKKGSDNKVAFETQASGGSVAASNAGGTSVYADISAMTAVTASAGDQAYVTANKSLYINNGTGWYKIATVNTTPTISAPSNGANITLAKDGTATSIEITAADVDEGTTIQYSYAVTTGSLTNGGGASATITSCATSGGTYASLAASTNTTNKFFKVTPTTNSSYAGTFSITFSASDTISAATTVQNFTLAFTVNASVVFDGTNNYLSIGGSADFEMRALGIARTIEFWVYRTSAGVYEPYYQIYESGNSSTRHMLFNWSSDNKFYNYHAWDLNNNIYNISTNAYTQTGWHHFAITRRASDNKWRVYFDGTAVPGMEVAATTENSSSGHLMYIGREDKWNGYCNGKISNFRIVHDEVYTANFTPPTVNLSAITNTKLLTCNDPSTIEDDSTSNHTITANNGAAADSAGPF